MSMIEAHARDENLLCSHEYDEPMRNAVMQQPRASDSQHSYES
jgi:hypothetical protein